jgi:hypothetical protein
VLRLQILAQAFLPKLPAKATLLEPSERSFGKKLVKRVDPYGSCSDRSTDLRRAANVTCPDCRREAVPDIIGQCDGVLLISEAEDIAALRPTPRESCTGSGVLTIGAVRCTVNR